MTLTTASGSLASEEVAFLGALCLSEYIVLCYT